MTQHQQNLVTENHKLIFFVLNLLNYNEDEWYDVCAIGLCKAAIEYKPERNVAFSTFAVKCMTNQIFMEQKKKYRRIRTVSLNEYITSDGNIEIQNTIDSADLFGGAELRLLIKDTDLTSREQKILKLHIAGYKQREIGASIGISQTLTSRCLLRAKRKIQTCLEET